MQHEVADDSAPLSTIHIFFLKTSTIHICISLYRNLSFCRCGFVCFLSKNKQAWIGRAERSRSRSVTLQIHSSGPLYLLATSSGHGLTGHGLRLHRQKKLVECLSMNNPILDKVLHHKFMGCLVGVIYGVFGLSNELVNHLFTPYLFLFGLWNAKWIDPTSHHSSQAYRDMFNKAILDKLTKLCIFPIWVLYML